MAPIIRSRTWLMMPAIHIFRDEVTCMLSREGGYRRGGRLARSGAGRQGGRWGHREQGTGRDAGMHGGRDGDREEGHYGGRDAWMVGGRV